MAAGGFAFTASHLEKPQVTKGSCPWRTALRLGSGFPRSGPAPWARRHRPSMAGGGYRGILAAVPTAQNLHSASRGGGASRSKAAGELTLGLLSGEKQKPYTDLLYVGASLLAKGSCQSTSKVDASPPSRAGSLPHLDFCRARDWGGAADDLRERARRIGRPVGRLAFAFDLLAPSEGRAQVLRSGHRGKDAAVAAPGHGWPMAAGPRSRTGAREP
jgi:hypothetical protein